jgi:hypothetical protein
MKTKKEIVEIDKNENAKRQAKAQLKSIIEMVKALETENDDERESALETIQNDPLSVEVRTGWHTPGSSATAEEFCILLCWGGPACRIIGELDEHGQPSNPSIQYQDWFTEWTDFIIENDDDQEALQTYCEQFYFEE